MSRRLGPANIAVANSNISVAIPTGPFPVTAPRMARRRQEREFENVTTDDDDAMLVENVDVCNETLISQMEDKVSNKSERSRLFLPSIVLLNLHCICVLQ